MTSSFWSLMKDAAHYAENYECIYYKALICSFGEVIETLIPEGTANPDGFMLSSVKRAIQCANDKMEEEGY